MKKAQNPLFIRVLGNFPFLCRKHNSRCEELGKSVADGKELLATTISEYVDTASDATWDVISENIKSAIEENKFTFGGWTVYSSSIPLNDAPKYIKGAKFIGRYAPKDSATQCVNIYQKDIGYDISDVSKFLVSVNCFVDKRFIANLEKPYQRSFTDKLYFSPIITISNSNTLNDGYMSIYAYINGRGYGGGIEVSCNYSGVYYDLYYIGDAVY